MSSDYFDAFIREGEEQITELNNSLLALEDDPGDRETMDDIFRSAHTLKGNFAAMGFEDASELAHAIEDMLDEMREGNLAVTADRMDLVFEGVDRMEEILDEIEDGGEHSVDPSSLVEDLRGAIEEDTGAEEPNPDGSDGDDAVQAGELDARATEGVLTVLADPGRLAAYDGTVYHVRVDIKDRGMKSTDGMMALQGVSRFDLVAAHPPEDEIEDGEYEDGADLFVGGGSPDEIDSGLSGQQSVESVEVRDASEEVGELDAEPREANANAGADTGTDETGATDDAATPGSPEGHSSGDPVEAHSEADDGETATAAAATGASDPGPSGPDPGTGRDGTTDPGSERAAGGTVPPGTGSEATGEPGSERTSAAGSAPKGGSDASTAANRGAATGNGDVGSADRTHAAGDARAGNGHHGGALARMRGAVGGVVAAIRGAFGGGSANGRSENGNGADAQSDGPSPAAPGGSPETGGGTVTASGTAAGPGVETPGESAPETAGPDPGNGTAGSNGETPVSVGGDGDAAEAPTGGSGEATDGGSDDPTAVGSAGVSTAGSGEATASGAGGSTPATGDAEATTADTGGTTTGDPDVGSGIGGVVGETEDDDEWTWDEDDADAGEDGDDEGSTDIDPGGGGDGGDGDGGDDDPEGSDDLTSSIDDIKSVRVDVDQLDDLYGQVEQLVTSRIKLRKALEDADVDVEQDLDELDKTTSSLQDTVMDMRLVPMKKIVGKFPRVVRDLSREQGKEIDFEMTGTDVELDRTILDRLSDPLIHILRNSVDHGIEPPEEREAAGKPREGSIVLAARRERDRAIIKVEDDGRGLDAEEIRKKAYEQGIRSSEELEQMDDEDVYDLIFHPGFSTTEEVTDVSGRGVGMDVVHNTVTRLDGSVSVDSDPGEGTTVTLELPVSIAIVKVLFVEAGDQQFGVPIKKIDKVSRFDGAESVNGQEMIEHDDELYKIIHLHEALDTVIEEDYDGSDGEGMLIRVRGDERRVALYCDAVSDQEEVVVKPLEGVLSGTPGLSGTAVLGEGNVVPVLDVKTI